MISDFKIGNFKAFGSVQTIPLRPITLVFGPNSAGKSSIIQSLLLARHALDTGKLDAHQTTLGGTSVDLGGFARYVHRHQVNRETTFHLTFKRFEIGGRFHYFDSFEALTLAYSIGISASGHVGILSVTILLDGCELLHVVRLESGVLQVDKAALQDRSLFALANLWSNESLEDFGAIRDIFVRLNSGPQAIFEIAGKLGLTSADLVDVSSGKPSLASARRVYDVRRQQIIDDLLSDDLETLSRAAREYPRTPNKAEQLQKDAVIEGLGAMIFQADRLKLECLNPLPRENYDYDEMARQGDLDRPNSDPIGFFKRLDSEASEGRIWAMALQYDLECLIEAASDVLTKELSDLSFLGPLRCIPPRHMLETDDFDATWVAGGGDAWQRLRKEPTVVEKVNRFLRETLRSRYTIRSQNFVPEIDPETLQRCIRVVLDRMTRAVSETQKEELVATRVAEDSPSYGSDTPAVERLAAILQGELSRGALTVLQLFDREAGIEVSHRDVGTGISQLLPVIVNAAASERRLIAIEQPELHLHPELQAELGDVFIESALGPNRNAFLIETHSEHLILRILRRIRESAENTLPYGMTSIRPEEVCVLYVEPGNNGSKVVHLPANAEGDFDKPWPDGFFPERARELF